MKPHPAPSALIRSTSTVRLALLLVVLVATACDAKKRPGSVSIPSTSALVPTSQGQSAVPHAPTDWCLEHGLAESMCTKCNPDLVPKFRETGDWCAAHGFPESVCPSCNPQPPPAGAEQSALEARVVRFRSPEIESIADIQTVEAKRTQTSTSLECPARIQFDDDRVADVRAVVPGVVRRVRVELGAQVERGTPLFELESTRVSEIQGALQTARQRERAAQAHVERQRELRESDIASARQLELAEQELAVARSEVRTAEAALRMTGATGSAPSGRYSLTAPIAGTVVRRPALLGMLATESQSLATIADVSVMWALCDVPETESSRIELGQPVSISFDDRQQSAVEGRLTWVSSEVDARTRTVTVRAELPNPDGRLRANQFVRVRIRTAAPKSAVSVPRAAVQRVGTLEVVFVRTAKGVYEPRVVTRGGEGEDVSIEGRVQPGDAVVTTGAVLLRTEIMPGSIGAGCCDVTPAGHD